MLYGYSEENLTFFLHSTDSEGRKTANNGKMGIGQRKTKKGGCFGKPP